MNNDIPLKSDYRRIIEKPLIHGHIRMVDLRKGHRVIARGRIQAYSYTKSSKTLSIFTETGFQFSCSLPNLQKICDQILAQETIKRLKGEPDTDDFLTDGDYASLFIHGKISAEELFRKKRRR